MRRSPSTSFAALVAITLAPACRETSDWVADPGVLAWATRTVHNNHQRGPFFLPDAVDNPCTSAIEAIDLEGTIHGQGAVGQPLQVPLQRHSHRDRREGGDVSGDIHRQREGRDHDIGPRTW